VKKVVTSITQVTLYATMLLGSQSSSAVKPTFEVATIKQNISQNDSGGAGARGDRFTATNVPIRTLINYAYAPAGKFFLSDQIIGGPEWIKVDKYDVQGKIPGDPKSVPISDIKLMVQALLEDRCQMKAHTEKRELPVYDLVVGKGGLKIKESPDQTPPAPGDISFTASADDASPPPRRGSMRIAGDASNTLLMASAVPVSKLVPLLQGQADRIIVDKTDVKALYDFNLRYSRELSAAAPTGSDAARAPGPPSFFTAIQELGLKLEPSKAMFDVVVIDSIERPKQDQ